MTEQAPITWLLATKNSMPYLTATLESIATQTYRNHKVLAWDDCSTDGSLEELERWIPHRIPGRIFSGQSKRLGPCLAFLLEQADTELCARIDGDDVNLPTRLERQVEVMLKNPAIGVLGSYLEVIDGEGKHVDIGTSRRTMRRRVGATDIPIKLPIPQRCFGAVPLRLREDIGISSMRMAIFGFEFVA